jgi:hypothetical protein
MRHSARNTLRGVFGALVVAGLGFGASEALATPAVAQAAAGVCLREEGAACNADCREAYGTNWRGRCTKDAWGFVNCECFELIFP